MYSHSLLRLLSAVLLSVPPGAAPSSVSSSYLTPAEIRLELPDFGVELHAPGIVRIPEPEKIRRFVLHVPRGRVQSATPKLNTLGMGLVQTTLARKGEIRYEIDLARHEGRYYELGPADNTIEIKVIPSRGAEPLYASWVIAPSQDANAWRISEPRNSDAVGSAPALEILERFDDGREVALGNGIATARRVVVRARVAKSEHAPSLRITRTAPGADPWSNSFGVELADTGGRGSQPLNRPAPQIMAVVDLEIGENRIEVTALDGTRALTRSAYRVLRRALTAPTEVAGEKWAVVIGISKYREAGLDLRYAHRDAQALHDVLVEQGGFSPQRTLLLTDENATLAEIRTALFSFLNAAKPEDLALIFLAGHGVQDSANPDNFFFLAHDSVRSNLGGTALPMWDLKNIMDNVIRAQRIVVLADTCHSGRVADEVKNSTTASFNFFNKYLEVQARRKGRLIATASQAHQSSIERDDLSHGVFTDALLRALRGAADDHPSDGVVTMSEAFDFVRNEVPAATYGQQHPSIVSEMFDGNLPFTRAARGPSRPR